MTISEIKELPKEEILEQIKRLQYLITLKIDREINVDKLNKYSHAYKTYDVPGDAGYVEITFEESKIITTLKTNKLGREGLLLLSFIGITDTIQSLLDKNIIHIFENFNGTKVVGLVGEEYPLTQEEYDQYTIGKHSSEMSYSKFKELLSENRIKWTKKAITDFINEDLQQLHIKYFGDVGQKWFYFCENQLNDISTVEDLILQDKDVNEIYDYIIDNLFSRNLLGSYYTEFYEFYKGIKIKKETFPVKDYTYIKGRIKK